MKTISGNKEKAKVKKDAKAQTKATFKKVNKSDLKKMLSGGYVDDIANRN